jgi:hypothetical protein
MDAVNALLTMKSRSTSMPVNLKKDQEETSNRKGRRKQLFCTPTKRKAQELVRPVSSDEFESDEYNSFDLEVSDEEQWEDVSESEIEREAEINKMKTLTHQAQHKKNAKKLLVKFSCFKPANKNVEPLSSSSSANVSISSGNSDEEDRENQEEPLKIETKNGGASSGEEKMDHSGQKSDNNALLELSKAACFVEKEPRVDGEKAGGTSVEKESTSIETGSRSNTPATNGCIQTRSRASAIGGAKQK